MKKNFSLGVGLYYFTVKTGGPNGILIKRNKKEEAINAFQSYKKVGKDCEWHGCWDGKKFKDDNPPGSK